MMRRLLILAVLLGCAAFLHAQCSNTTYGSFTCVSTSNGYSGSSQTSWSKTLSVTSGNAVFGYASSQGTTGTITVSGSGSCGNTVTYGSTVSLGSSTGVVWSTTASSTGTCTISMSESAANTLYLQLFQWSGWNGTYDTSGALVSRGSVSSGTSTNCPSVTTTVNGDLIACIMLDGSQANATWTPTSPFSLVTSGSGGVGLEEDVQSTAGAITGSFKYGNSTTLGAATFSLEVNGAGGTPSFSLAAGTYNSSLPRSTIVLTISAGYSLCVTSCFTSGCTPPAPTAPTAGTCSTGTQYNTTSQSLTLPVGYSNYSALATKSGATNSLVGTSGQYLIQPTIAGLIPLTVGPAIGNVFSEGSNYLNPASGYLSSFIGGLESPITGITETVFMDMHGTTSGTQPTATTLGNSSYSSSAGNPLTWSTSAIGAGLNVSNAQTWPVLPRPINVNGTVHDASGTNSIICTSTSGTVTATYCDAASLQFSNSAGSASVGAWYTSNCNNTSGVDCGALLRLDGAGGATWMLPHFNPGGGGANICVGNGIMLEDSNVNAPFCLPYVNGGIYRVNLQKNSGMTAITSTFTNSSASISGTNTLVANDAVQLSTTGTLPGGFLPGQFTVTANLSSGSNTFTATAPTGYSIFVGQTVGGDGIPPGTTVTNYSGSTVTMSNNASATITSGTVGFSGATYYVLSTGLSGSAYELATQQGGPAIVASGTGSGTITAAVMDQETICLWNSTTNTLNLVGSLQTPSNTTAQTPNMFRMGVLGEGPSITGFNFYFGGFTTDITGQFSNTACVM